METTNGKFYAALAKAQAEFEPVIFDKINPHFKSKFASLSSLRNATRPALTKYGISVTHPFKLFPGGFIVVTRLAHESGEYVDSEFPINVENKTIQQRGSEISYAERYSYAGAVGVSAEEDDDGEEAMDRNQKQKPSYYAPKEKKVDSVKYLTDTQIENIERLLDGDEKYKKAILKNFKVEILECIEEKEYALIWEKAQAYVSGKKERVAKVEKISEDFDKFQKDAATSSLQDCPF